MLQKLVLIEFAKVEYKNGFRNFTANTEKEKSCLNGVADDNEVGQRDMSHRWGGL